MIQNCIIINCLSEICEQVKLKRFICFTLLLLIFTCFVACSVSDNNYDKVQISEEYTQTKCNKDSLDEFFAVFGENAKGEGLLSGITLSREYCYNVTSQQIVEETEAEIFKFSNSGASFILLDGSVSELCHSFGGFGFVNGVTCDFDNDGNKDILFSSSWGSGLHRSIISVFNTQTKEVTDIYDTSKTDNPSIDLVVKMDLSPYISSTVKSDSVEYVVYSADIKVLNDNFADIDYTPVDIVGTIKNNNGVPTFYPYEIDK